MRHYVVPVALLPAAAPAGILHPARLRYRRFRSGDPGRHIRRRAGGPGHPGHVWRLLSGLSAVAGSLDALSYLAFGGVFTANMTGTVVLLAIAITGSEAGALRLVVALAAFVLGAIVGARPTRRSPRPAAHAHPAWPGITTATLAVELLVVTAWAVGWTLTGGTPVRLRPTC